MRAIVVLLTAIFIVPIPVAAQDLWGPLTPGPYPVGFSVLALRDSTRTLDDGTPRPVQVSYWYPAVADAATDSARMTVRDYFLLTAGELTLEPVDSAGAAAAEARFKEFLASNGVAATVVEDWFSRSGIAVRNARPLAGMRFPLVLIALGNFHAAYNQSVLGEFLASHGYVVATSPSQSRITGPPKEGEAVRVGAEAQAADLMAILDALGADPRVDTTRVGVVAHSFGARSAFLLSLQRDVDALVSWDGGIANRNGKSWLDGFDYDPLAVRTSILHFYQDVDEAVVPDFDFLDSLVHADRQTVRMDSLYHPHFSSLGNASGAVPGFAVGPASPDVLEKIRTLLETTHRFLGRHLKGAFN